MAQQDEKTFASANYVLNFVNDVELILDYAVAYSNILIMLKLKYSDKESFELNANEQESLQEVLNALRGLVYKTHIKINVIENKNDLTKLNSKYKDIMDSAIPKTSDIDDYIKELHKIVYGSVILNKIFNTSKKEIEGLSR